MERNMPFVLDRIDHVVLNCRDLETRSCNVQPLTPEASSSNRLRLEMLPMGNLPAFVNTYSPFRGKSFRIASAKALSGRTNPRRTLFRETGSTQSRVSPLTSAQRIS